MKAIKFSILLGIVGLFSCTEDTQVNLISGRLFEDCNTPAGSSEIALKANVGSSFGDPILLGSGITQANGVFNFTYELEEDDQGTADIILITNRGFETLISGIDVNENIELTLYRRDTGQVVIQLTGSKMFDLDDTLFYGLTLTGEEKFVVQPANGIIDTFYYSKRNTANNKITAKVYFGDTKVDFDLARVATTTNGNNFQNRFLIASGCSPIDTILLPIN